MEYKIILNWTNLKYEIDYETYKAAAVNITENVEVRGEAQSDNTNGDSDFCRTKIEAALANLESRMHRYMVFAGTQEGTDDLNRKTKQWTMTIAYADSSRRNFNVSSLTSKCHRYVVDYVLQEWAKLTMPTLVEGYVSRMNAEIADIETIVYRKEAPVLMLNDGTDDSSTSLLPDDYTGMAVVFRGSLYPMKDIGEVTTEKVYDESEVKGNAMTGTFVCANGNVIKVSAGLLNDKVQYTSSDTVLHATKNGKNYYYIVENGSMTIINTSEIAIRVIN